MKSRVLLAVAGLAGTAVLIAQIKAGANVGSVPAVVPVATSAIAGGCTPSTGPDVIVGDLSSIQKFGTVGTITAYAIGTESCNIGSQPLSWDQDTNLHPVIGQNLYRLKDGRFEQLGMSWLKHGFAALTLNLCCSCQNPGTSQLLGVGCSDPYGASLNGDQNGFPCGGSLTCGGLGPRSEVNAASGEFAFPYGSAGLSGDAIYKRLQVQNDDINPALNTGALYYAEGHYVARDDADFGNAYNNASYEQALVGGFSGGGWNLSLTGSTTRGSPAIFAWKENDPEVVIVQIGDEGKGRFYLGYRVTDNGDGTWHYEYALHNLNSHRSAREFIVPVGQNVTLTNVEFHDVPYHSGEPYSNAPWTSSVSAGTGSVSWSTETYAQNPDANALRWSTLYNFRFDASTPPTDVTATIGLFRPDLIMEVAVDTLGPSDDTVEPCPWDCAEPADGVVDVVDFLALLAQWGQVGTACDGNGGGVDVTDFLDMIASWGPCP
jgi:hypothetical protein